MKCGYHNFSQQWSSEHSSHCMNWIFSIDCKDLHTVDLSNAYVGSNDATFRFESLQEENCFVKQLDLSKNFLIEGESGQVNSALKALLELGNRCRLQVLKMSNCDISDITCRFIAEGLAQNESLTTLDLSNNSITASGAISIFESLNINATLKVLSLANNPGIADYDKSLTSAVENMLSINTSLRDLNLLNAVSSSLIEGISNALIKHHSSMLKVLQIDISSLSTEAIAYLLEAISGCPHLSIKGPKCCITFNHVMEAQCQIRSIVQLKIFCALHQISNVNLSTSSVANIHTLNLANLSIDAKIAISLFRCLKDNKWLEELNLSQRSHSNVLAKSDNTSLCKTLEQMLSKNVSLKILNLCNVVNLTIASGLISGLKNNKSLRVLHIDIRLIDHSQVAELLHSFSSSELLHINVESLGIFHAIPDNVTDDINKYWCARQHHDIHSLSRLENLCDLYQCLQNEMTLLPRGVYRVQINSRWCMHLQCMLPKFYTALSEGMHLKYEIVLDMMGSIKTVPGLNATFQLNDIFELPFQTCRRLQIEHIYIGGYVKLTDEMVVTLFESNRNLQILTVDAAIGDNVAAKFAQQIPSHSSLRELVINIENLTTLAVAKLIQSVETSSVKELKLIPFLIFRKKSLGRCSWYMEIIKSGSLDHVHRLYKLVHQNYKTKCGMFNALGMTVYISRFISNLSHSVSILKSLEKEHYPFLEGLHLDGHISVRITDEDEHCQVYNTIENILTSTKCKLKVLRIGYIPGSMIARILLGLRMNNSLTALNVESCKIKGTEVIELFEILQEKSVLTELNLRMSLTCEKTSPSLDIKNKFEQLLRMNTTLKTLGFHMSVNCDQLCRDTSAPCVNYDDVCAEISAALHLNHTLERLSMNADNVTEIGVSSLLSSVSNNSICALNHIEIDAFFVLKKSKESWDLEVNCECTSRVDYLFRSLNSTASFKVLNPVIVLHYNGYAELPLCAFDERFSRSFEFTNMSGLTTLIIKQNHFDGNLSTTAIETFFSRMVLDTLDICCPENMSFAADVISYINEKELSLKVLRLRADVKLLSKTVVLNLITALTNNDALTEVCLGDSCDLKLKRESSSHTPAVVTNENTVEFCKFFGLLSEFRSDALLCSILESIRKLDFSHVHIDNAVVIQLLKCIHENSTLEELYLPNIRKPDEVELGKAIKDALATNTSIKVLNVKNYSYQCVAIAHAIADGLAQNSSLESIYVHPFLIHDGTLLKSAFSHCTLLSVHIFPGCTIIRESSEDQWQLIFVQDHEDNNTCKVALFCGLTKVCSETNGNEGAIKFTALSILQHISTLQINFFGLFGLVETFTEAVRMSSTLKCISIDNCLVNDALLDTIKALTCSTALEKVNLQIAESECVSFDDICDAVKASGSLKELNIHLSSPSHEAISILIEEFNKSDGLNCDVQISFPDVAIHRYRESAAWIINFTSTGETVPKETLYTIAMTLNSVQNVNVSFCFPESVQSVSMLYFKDRQQIIHILQGMVGHKPLKYLNVSGRKCFANSNSHAVRTLCNVLSPPSILEYLNMTACSIDDTACTLIADKLKLNTTLKTLILSLNQIQYKGASKLFQVLKGCSTLTSLSLSGNRQLTIGDDEMLLVSAIQDMLKSVNSSLMFLDLSYCGISDQVCEGISCGLAGNTTLKELVLQKNTFTDRGIINLLKNSTTKLEHLNLSSNKQLATVVNPESDVLRSAFEQLLTSNTSLVSLNLCGSINDTIARTIISCLRINHSLRELNVDQCQLSANTVVELLASCEYEGFILYVTEMKCTYKCICSGYSDQTWTWWVEDITCQNSKLFYLLVLSIHGRLTTIGQEAYEKVRFIRDLTFSSHNLSSSQFFSVIKSLKFIRNPVQFDLSGNKQLLDGTAEPSTAVCSTLNEAVLHKQIKALNVSSIGIHPSSWQGLFTGLSSASSLEVLDISGNRLGEEGARALFQMLASFGGVIKLNIYDCDISDEFFTDNIMDVLTTQGLTLALNCDQHQLELLHLLNHSLEEFEITSCKPYYWWPWINNKT